MQTLFSPTFRRVLPTTVFERLQSLWTSLGDWGGAEQILWTEADGSGVFFLLLTASYQALLQGEPVSPRHYAVTITFDSGAVANLLKPSPLPPRPTQEFPHLLQQLTLRLLDILTADPGDPTSPAALKIQASQEAVLSQVIAQIRQSLDLSEILRATVTEVRRFLWVDRLVIYQFNPPLVHARASLEGGKIICEATASEEIPSLLGLTTEHDCFTQVTAYEHKYLNGAVVEVNDIETHYSSSYCLINLLQKYQIRAKLIAPIVVEGQLWGLLIAHQCHYPRQWLDSEKSFLGQIGEHLAVAIFQSQLYAQVQHQKNSFEKRVIERTKDLRSALLAAQAANHLKGEFLNNITHELRTPLTCIIGLSGTLLHWSNRGSSLPVDKQQHYLETIQESGKRLMELINDIIDLSQLESGQSVLHFQEFSLQALGQKVLHYLEEAALAKNLTLTFDLQIRPEEDSFCADPERLEQILTHLLQNGIKYTPNLGSVTLRVWRENKQAIFQVEDTGVGMSAEQVPFLFEAFKQLNNNQQRTYESTGLGLALTKQLVELHGGRVEVDSTLGKGSIFTLFIPYQKLGALKKASPSAPLNLTVKANSGVVVIEQDEEVATLICELLTAADYQVIWLIDSAIALRQIEVLQPGLVLIDKDLDNVHSISRHLKESHQLAPLKVILLSEQISSSEWQTFSQNGIDDYLLKPLQPDLLLQRLSILQGG
ncbi:MAG: ATP-binding protein [Cyanobacteriota bacterium]|nr:ATP-binding protein [Cyanobacteriota bacterium]